MENVNIIEEDRLLKFTFAPVLIEHCFSDQEPAEHEWVRLCFTNEKNLSAPTPGGVSLIKTIEPECMFIMDREDMAIDKSLNGLLRYVKKTVKQGAMPIIWLRVNFCNAKRFSARVLVGDFWIETWLSDDRRRKKEVIRFNLEFKAVDSASIKFEVRED